MEAKVFNALLKEIKYDKSAIERIYEEYAPAVKLYLSCRFDDSVEIDDVVHEVFFRLMITDWSQHKEVKSPSAWLNKIAYNLALEFIRKRHSDCPLDTVEEVVGTFDMDKIIVANDVKMALSYLDDLTAQIIYLNKYEGYKFKDIAEQLSMTTIAVRVRASRGYKKLEKICNKYHLNLF